MDACASWTLITLTLAVGWFPRLERLTAQSQFKLPSLQFTAEPPADKENTPDKDSGERMQLPGFKVYTW